MIDEQPCGYSGAMRGSVFWHYVLFSTHITASFIGSDIRLRRMAFHHEQFLGIP
jgi:hypothetical protein